MGRSLFFVLIVDPDRDAAPAWRQAVERARLDKQVYLVHTSAEAIEYILKVRRSPSLTTPGVVLVQSAGGSDPIAQVVRWLRAQQSLACVIPVALIDPARAIEITALYDAGARSCLPAPESVEDRVNLLSEVRNYWQALNVWPELGPRLGT
ncbi:MAG: hypothetical protein JO332_06840 [Planctomycetaceae bacterium]|nr:hypothetical protein [Planctomycetaceae bacterium]